MNSPTHTIDPDGEVIIILRNANSPFAQLAGNLFTSRDSDILPWFFGNTKSSHEVTEVSKFRFEPLELSLKEQSRKKKKKGKKRKSGTTMTAFEFTSTNEEPAAEEAAAEEHPAEEPVAEEPAAEEPAAEEHPAEEPVAEEPAAEEPVAEEPAAEEHPAEEHPAEEHPAEEHPAEEPVAEEAAVEGDFAELPVHNCLRIQVSAKHLMFASPVFKKILTGGWKESITYFKKGSVEVTAESWDIEALMILLRAIHGQYYRIPRKLTLEMLAKIAVIADYYECREALYFLTDMWIKNVEEKIPTAVSRDLVLWLWIAWFFRLPSQFKLSTSIAMSQSDGRIGNLGLPIPDNVIGSMNESREKAINNLIVLLHETRNAFLHGTRGCGFECRSIMYGALTMEMQSSNLLVPKPENPSPNLDYNSLMQRVMAFRSPGWYVSSSIYSGYSSYGSSSMHRCSDSSFASVFDKLEDSLEGLELNRFTSSQFGISVLPSK
ncbi:hypothetical protein N7516_008142 [Penicillium verrucosum]|uniref:uncharacterized protein n=1 Tax=Penicillium verrucosum TaxID=60171 RepID=UPI0025453427|nr:uncharacterized protein N7516_008142 [Penicillium verrucosum]KAJ5926369.1 hypothetical protein N7516_008142 [Penicillium verrucosum]